MTRRRVFLTAFCWTFAFLMGLLVGAFMRLQYGLPKPAELQEYKPIVSTRLYDIHGEVIADFAQQRREVVSLDKIPKYIKDGVVAVEDKRFYHHWGIDVIRLFGMTFYNLKHLRLMQGGSTITQQLARNMFLNMEQTLDRKLKEAMLAVEIERAFSKNEILELYLNQVYFGHGAYGVQAAARTFFDTTVTALTISRCAALSALPANQAYYAPYEHKDRTIRRRNLFLRKLLEMHSISQKEYDKAQADTLVLAKEKSRRNEAPYFVEEIRKYIEATYGPDFIYTSGAKIYTTLDLRVQRAANAACTTRLAQIETDHKKAFSLTKHQYDSIVRRDSTAKPDYLQCAILALDPHDGGIRAMVGGRSFAQSYFNRTIQAHRQPGSAFKVFVYTAAMDNGYSPDDVIDDAELRLIPPGGGPAYVPHNYDNKFMGTIDLWTALALSRNVVAVKLISEVGPEVVVNYARRMGITDPLKPYYSLALGACEVKLIDMTSAFGVLCNDGVRVAPRYINRIVDPNGRVIEEQRPKEGNVLSQTTARTMVSMMRRVVDNGTGYSIRRAGFDRPAAGKTGTTDDFADAWFVGFTPELACGVWVGYDQRRKIFNSASGGEIAAPIWARVMRGSKPPAVDAFNADYEEVRAIQQAPPETTVVVKGKETTHVVVPVKPEREVPTPPPDEGQGY